MISTDAPQFSIDDIFGPCTRKKIARPLHQLKYSSSQSQLSSEGNRSQSTPQISDFAHSRREILPPLQLPQVNINKPSPLQVADLQVHRPIRPVPAYLRPRATVKTNDELEAHRLALRARSLLEAACHAEMLAINPNLDPIAVRRRKQAEAEDRAHQIAQLTAESVSQRAVAHSLRAERAAMVRDRELKERQDEATFANGLKQAQVSIRRSLQTDPILREAIKAQRARERASALAGPESAQADKSSASVSIWSAPASSSLSSFSYAGGGGSGGGGGSAYGFSSGGGGHSKDGDEVLRRARLATQRALAQLGS